MVDSGYRLLLTFWFFWNEHIIQSNVSTVSILMMMMMNRRKKVITTNFTTFQTNILINNNIITLIAIYILLFLYTGIIDTIITPFYGGKSTKKEQKRTIISLFLCKNRKKISCWMNGAQSKGIEPHSKQVRNLKYTVQW